MAFYRVAMRFPFDSTLPRDEITVNPHFSGTDPQQLLNALKTNLDNFAATAGKPYTLKAYDATKAPPSYPLATITNPGSAPGSNAPREIALCLSYFSTYNRPRYRGRLFLPSSWLTSSPLLRPSTTVMNNAMTFATEVLTKSLPQATNWIVWSKTAGQGYGVTDFWVDDEWDTVRSRGLRPTTRVTGKV